MYWPFSLQRAITVHSDQWSGDFRCQLCFCPGSCWMVFMKGDQSLYSCLTHAADSSWSQSLLLCGMLWRHHCNKMMIIFSTILDVRHPVQRRNGNKTELCVCCVSACFNLTFPPSQLLSQLSHFSDILKSAVRLLYWLNVYYLIL